MSRKKRSKGGSSVNNSRRTRHAHKKTKANLFTRLFKKKNDKSASRLHKNTKIKLFTKIKYIYDHNYDGLVKRFIYVNVTHIFFETLISVYILEMLCFFTKLYIIEPNKISQLRIIVIPFALMIALSIIFGIWVAYYFANNVYIYANEYEKTGASDENFKSITARYRNQIIRAQIFGSVLYTVSTIIIPFIFINLNRDNISNPENLTIVLPILGSILGIIWNLTGICRNQRLLWTKLLPNLSSDKTKFLERKKNFNCYVWNAVGILVGIVVVFVLFVIVLFNLHESLFKEKILDTLTTYGILFVYFVTLVGLYIKFVVKHLFFNRKDNNVFPSMERILKS